MAKPIASKKVSKERYAIYWDKSMEFYETMVDASQKGNWNAVGLAGVHCCISATDALLVKYAGIRSSSDDHQDVLAILKTRISHPETAKQTRRLAEILAEKNLIEYVDKSYPSDKALALKISVERYVAWAKKLV